MFPPVTPKSVILTSSTRLWITFLNIDTINCFVTENIYYKSDQTVTAITGKSYYSSDLWIFIIMFGADFDFFGITIEGSSETYSSGQTVNGQVLLDTREELTNIKFIKVKIKGIGDVHWTERVRLKVFSYSW